MLKRMTADDALAAYHALDARRKAVVDAWVAHAFEPAGRYHPCTRCHYEWLVRPCPYVTAAEFNGCLLAHGFKPRYPRGGFQYPTQYKARLRPEVRTATTAPASAPRWLPEIKALAQTKTAVK